MSAPDKRPLIYQLLENPLSGAEIEALSLAAIDAEAPAHRHSPQQWQVVRRLIHTSADFAMSDLIHFSPTAITAAGAALRAGKPLYADSNMIRSGISLARLRQVNAAYRAEDLLCHIADPDVAAQAHESGLPRSLFALRKAAAQLEGAIVLIGNAPVALLELNRLVLEKRIRPALVIGMPVGFVHVLESKEELLRTGLPAIVLKGRRGGSPLAVAALHALCALAAETGHD